MIKIMFAILSISLLAACSEPEPPVEASSADVSAENENGNPASYASGPCVDTNGLKTYCGFKNPEDIVVTPDGKQLIISEMGEFMLDSPGSLVLFDLDDSRRNSLQLTFAEPENNWADSKCPPPDPVLFSPHGIDLITRQDGRHQLLVVNHGGREAVEMFEFVQSEENWRAEWRGCVLPPEDPFINDVSGLSDGGFLVTHMWNKTTPFEEVVAKLTAGANTGWIWRWNRDKGFSKLTESDQQMPNGIAVSRDNRFAFVNLYMGNKTIKIDLSTGEKVGEFSVRQPDNITLDDEGNLWVASHQHDPINQTCNEVETGACLLPFQIIKANPETLETEVFLEFSGEPMGYTTVATRAGNVIYMGSAHGDRIASVPIQE